jgi:hypothetical protein
MLPTRSALPIGAPAVSYSLKFQAKSFGLRHHLVKVRMRIPSLHIVLSALSSAFAARVLSLPTSSRRSDTVFAIYKTSNLTLPVREQSQLRSYCGASERWVPLRRVPNCRPMILISLQVPEIRIPP